MDRLAAVQALFPFGIPGFDGDSRQLLDLCLDRVDRQIDEWELCCAGNLDTLRTRPPAQAGTDVLVDLLALYFRLDTADAAERKELQRIAAALCCIEANALTRLGEHGAAIRWWRTARNAADNTGDLDLRILVRGEEAVHGLYGQRSPDMVLTLVEKAQHLAVKPDVDLMTTQAKALSLLGRHEEAIATLDELRVLAEGGVVPDRYGFWTPSRLHFTESWVYAASGDEKAADAARRLVLNSRDYQYRANVRLHGALATVVNGGVDEGMTLASETVNDLSPEYRSRHVVETGRIVLHAVPREQRHRPAVVEFRAVLSREMPIPPDFS